MVQQVPRGARGLGWRSVRRLDLRAVELVTSSFTSRQGTLCAVSSLRCVSKLVELFAVPGCQQVNIDVKPGSARRRISAL